METLVTLKNTGAIYNGDDKVQRIDFLQVKTNAEAKFSYSKALKLAEDFPDRWLVVEAPPELKSNIEAVATASAQKKRLAFPTRSNGTRVSSPQTVIKTVPAPSIVEVFVMTVKENKAKVEKVKASAVALLEKVALSSYVGADFYKGDITLLDGEIGADIKTMTRYILVDKEDKIINLVARKEEKKEEKKKEAQDNTLGVGVKQSKDFDVDDIPDAGKALDILANSGDDDEDEDHPKPGSKKKRPVRKMNSEEDDDDDDFEEEDDDK